MTHGHVTSGFTAGRARMRNPAMGTKTRLQRANVAPVHAAGIRRLHELVGRDIVGLPENPPKVNSGRRHVHGGVVWASAPPAPARHVTDSPSNSHARSRSWRLSIEQHGCQRSADRGGRVCAPRPGACAVGGRPRPRLSLQALHAESPSKRRGRESRPAGIQEHGDSGTGRPAVL